MGVDYEDTVRLTVKPFGVTGQLAVQVRLATMVWPDQQPRSRQTVDLELLTSYQRLSAFVEELRACVTHGGTARLDEEILADTPR